jgi:autotransporter-associated beta strand protein
MRKPLLSLAVVLSAGIGFGSFAPTASARTVNLIWNGGTGLWFSFNWSIVTAQPSLVDNIEIDNGNPINSVVTLVGTSSPNSVLLDAGDQLAVGDNTLGATNALNTATLTNNGLISPGSGQKDFLEVSGTLTNADTLESDNNSIFHMTASSLVNNGTIDVSESPGSTLADAEFNDSNIAGGMSITGTGNISVHDGGTLSIDHPVNINSTGYINANSNDPCILIDDTSNITLAGLTGFGSIAANGGNSTLTLNSPSSTTTAYSGVLSNRIGLVKNGAGTQILSGNNQYLGTTDITAGTLQVDNSDIGNGDAGSGNMTIHSGGTLAGIGSTSCFVTVQSGGTVSPGDHAGASAGTFTASITLLLNPGSTVQLDIGNAPNTSDVLNVSQGQFEASAANIQLVPHGTLTWHHTYTLINWSGAITLNGISASSFDLLPSGVDGTFVVDTNPNTMSFFVTANAGDANEDGKVDLNDLNIVLNNLGTTSGNWTNGNFDGAPTIDLTDLNDVLNTLGSSSVALSAAAAPEPTTLALLAGAIPLAVYRRRRFS